MDEGNCSIAMNPLMMQFMNREEEHAKGMSPLRLWKRTKKLR